MPEFLTTRGVSSKLESIIADSKKFLFLLSAYVHIPTGLIPEINAAIKRKVRVVLVYGKESELSDRRLEQLQKINGQIEIYFNPRLHAKAYLNEESCIITSLNLLEFSEMNNIEFGVSAERDNDIYKKLKEKIDVVISECQKVRLRTDGKLEFLGSATEFKSINQYVTSTELERINQHFHDPIKNLLGWCIRCGISTPYIRSSPFCKKCFKVWSQYADSSYSEKYCHQCGQEADYISKDRPVCKKCYKRGDPSLTVAH